MSPTHDHGGGLGAEQREAKTAGFAGEAGGRRPGPGEQAGEVECVGEGSVAQRGVDQATVRIVGAPSGHLPYFCQLGQVLLNLCRGRNVSIRILDLIQSQQLSRMSYFFPDTFQNSFIQYLYNDGKNVY